MEIVFRMAMEYLRKADTYGHFVFWTGESVLNNSEWKKENGYNESDRKDFGIW